MTHIRTVIIADDHPILRKGLREIIDQTGHYQVIAEADSGESALQYYQAYKPDIIILDISMGAVNGLEVAKAILQANRQALCVIMTMYSETAFCKRAMTMGVKGYLLKDDAADAIVDCLDKVRHGHRYISQSLGCEQALISSEPEEYPEDVLSDKELVILAAIATLKTNKQIAAEQNISYRTVQNHRHNISSKLNLSGRQALLQYAIQWQERTKL